MILSKKSILSALENNLISIVCHYYEEDSGESFFTKKLDCKVSYKNTVRHDFLLKQIEGTRISLTLGPLLHLLNNDTAPEGGEYHNYKSIVDLTQDVMSNGFYLQPNKTIVAITNEYIRLNPSIGGFIISRVNNNSLGLNVKSSYVSNGWAGLLKLTIRNESSSPFLLTHGMNIAGLFLYDVKEPEEVLNPDYFTANHYGITWQSVYERNENPFTVMPSTPANKSTYFKKLLVHKFNWGFDLAMLTVVGGILYGFVDMKNKLNSLTSEKNQLQLIQKDINGIKNDYARNKYQSGTSTVIINKGSISGSTNVNIKGVISSSHYIVTDVLNNKNHISSLETSVVGSSENHTLNIRLNLDKVQKAEMLIDIKWIVFP